MEVAVNYCTKLFSSLFILLAVVVSLSGCGGDSQDSSSSTAGPVEACGLLTGQELEVLFGAQVDPNPVRMHKVDDKEGFWMSNCSYFVSEINLAGGFLIRPLQAGEAAEAAYTAYKEELKASVPDYELQPVEGVGDVAGWEADMKQLVIFSGTHSVIVTAGKPGAGSEENLAFARKLGEAVISKL